MSSARVGGAGARGIRYEGSAAGTRGEGNDVLLEVGLLCGETSDTADIGRVWNNCDSLSDPPDVFLRFSGGRLAEKGDAPTTGEPARRADGTSWTEDLLVETGEPI